MIRLAKYLRPYRRMILLSIVAALAATGAMLAASLFVVPAATTRLWGFTLRTWQLASAALAMAEALAAGTFRDFRIVPSSYVRPPLPSSAWIVLFL